MKLPDCCLPHSGGIYVFSVVGTSRCDVRAACRGATPSNASAARSHVPPAATRAGTAQRAVPAIALNIYGGLRLRARAGFTLIECMVSSAVLLLIVGGVMTFINFAGVSASGITAQNVASAQAGYAIELIQNRTRFATSISNNAAGNSLTLGFDDNYTVDSDGDGKTYNDKNHFERFSFLGVNSTNYAACSSNRLVYLPNVSSAASYVLLPNGVRNLPRYNIFTITNQTIAIIRFGIVDRNAKDYYQAVEIQGTAVSLNRPAATNVISILP